MQTIKYKVTNRYPEETFDQQKQKEWAKAVIDRMYAYFAAAVSTPRRDNK